MRAYMDIGTIVGFVLETRKFIVVVYGPTWASFADELLLPVIEIRITLTEAIEERVGDLYGVGGDFIHMTDRNFSRFICSREKLSRICDE